MGQIQHRDRTLAEEIGLLASLVWANRWRLLLALTITFVLSAAATFLLRPRFTSTATVLPGSSGLQLGGMLGELSAFSGIAGLDVGGVGVDIYPVVARSNTIVSRVLATDFNGKTVLETLLDGEPGDSQTVETVTRDFKARIVTSKDLRSGSLRFEFTHRDPDFAAFVLNTILDNLETYFRETSGVEAREQRQLIESRITTVAGEVKAAEDDLKEFRTDNRTILTSPLLALEEGRLVRQVEIKNRIYLELAAQLEVSRIREAGSVTVLKILDRASRPQHKSWPQRSIIVIVAVLCVGGLYLVFLRWRYAQHIDAASA
jgi:uncharacterized protein involved in exopolysaccharide biosynthesis